MWRHSVPWVLTYWCGASMSANPFRIMGDAKGKGKPDWHLKILPHRAHFYLSYRNGELYYRGHISDGKNIVAQIPEVKTIITMQGIKDYFELVDEMLHVKELGDEVSFVRPNGAKGKWDHVKYCKACQAAKFDSRWDIFIQKAKELMTP